MMRLIMVAWWGLALCWLIAHPLEAESAPGDSPAPQKDWPRTVEGIGTSEQAAKANALKNLARELMDYLRARDMAPTEWQPTTEFIERNLVVDSGKKGPEREVPPIGTAITWIYETKPLDLTKVAAYEERALRMARSEQRLYFGMILVAVAMVVTGAVAGTMMIRERMERWKALKKPPQPAQPLPTSRI